MRAYFIANNQFSVSGDATDDFTIGRRIIANCGSDGTKYATVSSSVLNASNDTEVTIVESNITTNLERVQYGIVSTGAKGNMPVHDHSATNQGGSSVSPSSHGSTHVDGTDDVPDFVGDAGAGGTKGLVPAPAVGDDGAFLSGDGTWTEAPMTTEELKRLIWMYAPTGRGKKYNDNDAILAIRSSSWIQKDGHYIGTDQVRARDGDGLLLTDDGGNGMFVDDGGNVGIGTTSPNATVEVAGNAYIGDGTNYIEIKSDGEIVLHGTARYYHGVEVGATDFKEPASQSATLVNRGMGVAYSFADGSEEHIHAELRIPGKWVDTEDITLIGIWSSPAVSQDCDWEIKYLFRAEDEDMTVTTPDGTLQAYQTSSATANGLVHSVMTIPAADFDSGDKKLVFEVWRDGDDASDTLGDTAYVHAILVKGVANKLGGST